MSHTSIRKLLTRHRLAMTAFVTLMLAVFCFGPITPASASVIASPCDPGFIFLGARGTDEAPGMGGTVSIVQSMFQHDSNLPIWSDALVYPAVAYTTTNSYLTSVNAGVVQLRRTIEDLVTRCQFTTIVLVGYSQGAHVIGDVLAASDGIRLSPQARQRIAGVALFGDPTYRPGEPWDAAGDGKGGGLFERPAGAFASWTQLAFPSVASTSPVQTSIIRSYCFTGDRWCQKGLGPDAGTIHESYASKSTADAFLFLKKWLIGQD